MMDLCSKGLAVHHSGILPLLKEGVELLFAKGLIKLLFATETFAMGVNMPARTVLFDNIRKHDGKALRNLKTSEFIQMAGRAGRRGLDEVGTVIILCKQIEIMPIEELSGILLGKASNLESKFRLTYQMLLNQVRSAALQPYDILKRSFLEVEKVKEEPVRLKKLDELEKELKKFTDIPEKLINYGKSLRETEDQISKILLPAYNINLSQLVITKTGHLALVIGILQSGNLDLLFYNRNVTKPWNITSRDKPIHTEPPYQATSESDVPQSIISSVVQGGPSIKGVSIENIRTDIDRRKLPRFRDNAPGQDTAKAMNLLAQIAKSGKLREVQPKKSFENSQQLDKLNDNFVRLLEHDENFGVNEFDIANLETVRKFLDLEKSIAEVKLQLSNESLWLDAEYKARMRVLQRLEYIDSQNTVQLKGRVACNFSACHCEVVLTELLFNNFFDKLFGKVL